MKIKTRLIVSFPCPNSMKMVIAEFRKQDKNWIVFIQNYQSYESGAIDIFLE